MDKNDNEIPQETKKCFLCNDPKALLDALNSHPDALLHLSKRQVRLLGKEMAKAYMSDFWETFNNGCHKYGFRFVRPNPTRPEEVSVELLHNMHWGSGSMPDSVRRMVSDFITNSLLQEFSITLKRQVASKVQDWIADGSMDILVKNSVEKAIRDKASELIGFTCRQPKEGTANE